MATLTEQLTDASGVNVGAGRVVRVRAVADPAAFITADGDALLFESSATTDATGTWSMTVPLSTEVTPSGALLRVQVGTQVRWCTLPDTAGTFTVLDLLTDAPASPSPSDLSTVLGTYSTTAQSDAAYVAKAATSTSGFGFVLDEDTMSSNSAIKVPTQQSVKAYTDTALAKPAAAALFRTGRIFAFLGDSITDGSGASGDGTKFWRRTQGLCGTAVVSYDSLERGVAGETSTAILARTAAVIAEGPEALVLLCGTNDAQSSVALSTFSANVIEIVRLCRVAGIRPIVGTVPPMGSSKSAAIHASITQYNTWLRLWAPGAGVPLADVHGALVDATTGYIAAAYNSGDDVHPSDAGHFVIADAFSDVIKREVTPQPWPVASVDASNLATNPLFPDLTGWTDGGGTGTATPTSHTDTTGHLPYGKWMKYVISAAGGYRARTTVLSSSLYTVGETLLICAYMDATITDSAGYVQLNLNDGSTIKTIVRHIDDDAAPYQVTAPVMRKVVVPSLSGSLQIRLLASGVDTIGYLGAVGVFNLSRMGIA